MKDFKNIYKPVPERFSYTVNSALKEAASVERKAFGYRGVLKTAVITVLILALATTTVYGASELYKLAVNKRGEYGVGLSVEENKNSPEYVKLCADIKGYTEMKGTSGLKFGKADSNRFPDFSFSLSRPESGAEELYENVENYKTMIINNREAVVMTASGTMKMTRVSMYFEEVNIILTCYVNPEISEDEVIENLENVLVVEGSETDYTSYTVSSDFISSADLSFVNRYTACGENESFEVYSDIDASVEDFGVYDTAEGLDKADFYFWGDDVDEYISTDGTLYPRVSDEWNFGDGVNNTDEFIRSEKKEQKLVLADVTYVNNSDSDYTFSIDWRLQYLKESASGKLTMAEIYKSDRNIGDGLAQYIENANSGKAYYVYTLKPGESRTFTIGYLCDKELLSDAYLVCEKDSANSYEFSAVKVQTNG